jgi:hypothetical protein
MRFFLVQQREAGYRRLLYTRIRIAAIKKPTYIISRYYPESATAGSRKRKSEHKVVRTFLAAVNQAQEEVKKGMSSNSSCS